MEALKALARVRRVQAPPGYENIGDFHDGAYECDFVSPYSKGAGNVDSPLLVLLQDWCSADFLNGPFRPDLARIGREPTLPTNRNLEALLQRHFGVTLVDVYASNVFPWVKPAGMSSNMPFRALVEAARTFALQQIWILRPRLVVACGLDTFGAVAAAAGSRPVRPLAKAIASPLDALGTRIWCQAHPGALGIANRNRGGTDRVNSDWAEMAEWYRDDA